MTLIIRVLPTLVLFAGIITVLALILTVVATATLLYRYRKRSGEAGAVKVDIRDALLDQDALRGVTATVHVPFWGSRPTIILTGAVEDEDLRQFARHIAAAEASRVWQAVRIEDRMGQPARAEHVA